MIVFTTILSIVFVVVVLLQQKNSTLGSMMGGDAGDEMVQTRRGSDKVLHQLTIVLSVLLLGSGLYAMFFL